VVANAFIMLCLVFASIDFGRDFFLGAASGAVLVMLGESIAYLKKTKQQKERATKKYFNS